MIGAQNSSRCERLDDARKRLPFVGLITLVVWLGLLTMFGLLLNRAPAVTPDQAPIEARLIDLDGLAGGGGGSYANTSKGPAKSATNIKPKTAVPHLTALPPRPKTPHRTRQHKVELARTLTPPDQAANIHQSVMPRSPITPAQALPDNANSSASLSHIGTAAGVGAGHEAGAGVGSGVGPGSATGSGGGFGTGGSGPRAIYAPVPSIPDEMRDEVMRATAVVRFHVGRDGKATVTLVTSTEFSTLDELILETLRKWRFHPALRNGNAIDSDAEVRLLITVQ